MVWTGTKRAAYATSLVGVALWLSMVESSTGNSVSAVGLPPSKETQSKESQAARFAKGLAPSEDAIVNNERYNPKVEPRGVVDTSQERTSIAKSTQARNLKLSQKELKERIGEVAGTEGRNPYGRQGNDGRNPNRQGGGRNGNGGQQGAVEPNTGGRRNGGNRQNDANPNGMKVTRGRNSGPKSNQLSKRIGDESIAETLTRLQLKLRPVDSAQMRKRMKQLSGGGVNPFPYRYPKIRYVPWADLTEETKEILEPFGYNQGSWNYMSHIVESKPFSKLSQKQQENAGMLGMDENVWDCFINHYTAYGGKDLTTHGLDGYAAVLSGAQSKRWEELSRDEEIAASRFCYTREVWNRETLGTW